MSIIFVAKWIGKTDENPTFFSSLISWEYLYFLESPEAEDHFEPKTSMNQKYFSMHSRAGKYLNQH